jgi:PIN domain nuclease of toxin-antitoxin system
VRLLLDTATFIWAMSKQERISAKAMRLLGDPAIKREVSAVSIVEIAIKHKLGKLIYSTEDVLIGLAELDARVLPYTADHAFQLFRMPAHHSDPFDRQIIAQAASEEIPIVTSDTKFRLYKEVQVIW